MSHRWVVLLCCGRELLQSKEVEAVFSCTATLIEALLPAAAVHLMYLPL